MKFTVLIIICAAALVVDGMMTATKLWSCTARNTYAFPPVSKSACDNVLHTPEVFQNVNHSHFLFRIKQAHPAQMAGSAVISAVSASVNGKTQELRFISESIDKLSIVCLASNGTPYLMHSLKLAREPKQTVLVVETRCLRPNMLRIASPFFHFLQHHCADVLLNHVLNDCGIHEEGELACHRSKLFGLN
jgi:hypothetical protein